MLIMMILGPSHRGVKKAELRSVVVLIRNYNSPQIEIIRIKLSLHASAQSVTKLLYKHSPSVSVVVQKRLNNKCWKVDDGE